MHHFFTNEIIMLMIVLFLLLFWSRWLVFSAERCLSACRTLPSACSPDEPRCAGSKTCKTTEMMSNITTCFVQTNNFLHKTRQTESPSSEEACLKSGTITVRWGLITHNHSDMITFMTMAHPIRESDSITVTKTCFTAYKWWITIKTVVFVINKSHV